MKKKKKIKKALSEFMRDEKGFITKENILKIGLGTISVLGIAGALTNISASHASHDQAYLDPKWVSPRCYKYGLAHQSHDSHSSY